MGVCTIEEAIADIKAGKMIILVDDEDRENEGDLCMARLRRDTPKEGHSNFHWARERVVGAPFWLWGALRSQDLFGGDHRFGALLGPNWIR